MILFEMILLAIVQGVGEFLPISSSGTSSSWHQCLNSFGESFPGEKLTVISCFIWVRSCILVFYWAKNRRPGGREPKSDRAGGRRHDPGGDRGALDRPLLGAILESPLVAGFMFPIMALASCGQLARDPAASSARIEPRPSLLIGLAQAFAISAGVSRSGRRLCGHRLWHAGATEAATFLVLVGHPGVAGGGLLHLLDLAAGPREQPMPNSGDRPPGQFCRGTGPPLPG